jgi:hypothetical protein
MKLVIIESPFAGNVERNIAYAKAAMLDCLRRDEAPYASHLLYTQVLDDLKIEERKLGMFAGFEWARKADLITVYQDLGISEGMEKGIAMHHERGIPIEYRSIPNWDQKMEVKDAAI